MKVKDFPGYVQENLIERGWKPEQEITPEKAFDEYVQWEGLVGWGPNLRHLYADTVGQKES